MGWEPQRGSLLCGGTRSAGPRTRGSMQRTYGAIGFRVKSGRAIVVTLRGPAKSPSVVRRSEVLLRDPRAPNKWQPYHAVMDLPFEKADAAVRPLRRRVEKVAARIVRGVVKELRGHRLVTRGVGIVGGGGADPLHIGNPHIRAHAAEGKLYREVVEAGAKICKLPWRSYADKTVYEQAAGVLRVPRAVLNGRVGALGAGKVRPWSADEKMAALAAWTALRL